MALPHAGFCRFYPSATVQPRTDETKGEVARCYVTSNSRSAPGLAWMPAPWLRHIYFLLIFLRLLLSLVLVHVFRSPIPSHQIHLSKIELAFLWLLSDDWHSIPRASFILINSIPCIYIYTLVPSRPSSRRSMEQTRT